MHKDGEFINSLITRFLNKSLSKQEWTHEAHVVVAFWNCTQFPADRVLENVRKSISDYNLATGTPNTDQSGYHETLTVFWLELVTRFLKMTKSTGLSDSINRFLEAGLAKKELPLGFYSKELLFSVEARMNFATPDLRPLSHLEQVIQSCLSTHLLLNDKSFESLFASQELDPRLFNHEAHLRLAWIQIKNYGVDNAIENVCNQLIAFVNHLGETDKYNKTLTVAAVHAVNHFFSKSGSETFEDFVKKFPRLKFNFKGLMASHYNIDIFNSDPAKKRIP